jgi:transposase
MDYSPYEITFTAEGRRRVHAFSYVLGYCRRQYLHFVESEDLATTLREHVRAFEHFQGLAATFLYDNAKVVVTGYDGQQPIYNPHFLAFATHYGFRPLACRPRHPQTKACASYCTLFRFDSSRSTGATSFDNRNTSERLIERMAAIAIDTPQQTGPRPVMHGRFGDS